jgi:asparagine synthase (glutamine-hydrolysing)
VDLNLDGWVELDGRNLFPDDLCRILHENRDTASRFGGEFLLTWNGCIARDHFGIIPGTIEPGTIVCRGEVVGQIRPDVPEMVLDEAIREAVRLRGDEGICALSGGVDSTLIAALSGLSCLSIGTAGSHDLIQARNAAERIGLDCSCIAIDDEDIREGLYAVLAVLPDPSPVETAIAISQYLVTRSASDLGYRRVLSGQGADELFGGYARYLTSGNFEAELERDFIALKKQIFRDQTVAALHATRFSLPYMDPRVVRAARSIPGEEKLKEGIRKWPLRVVAARHIPPEIAWYEKKAMQYGTGVWKTLQRFARHNGYKKSVQGYLNQVITEQSDSFGGYGHDRREGC